MRSLSWCTPWVANPPNSVKDKRLRRACGILDSTSRACCVADKSSSCRTKFIHAGVQLAIFDIVKIDFRNVLPEDCLHNIFQ